MRKLLKILASFAVLGFVLGLTACSGGDTIQVAVVLPLSGEHAVYGEPMKNAIELAHRQIQQEEHPYRLELAFHDTGSDPEKAAELLRQAYEGGAFAAIGGVTSDEAQAMVPVVNAQERLLVSPSASSQQLTGASRYFFRIFPSDLQEGTKMGNFAAQKLDLENVVVLAADNSYAQGITQVFENEFERYEREVLERIVYPAGTEDFGQVLDQVMEINPQAVYVADFAQPVGRILSGLKERGFRGTLLTTSAFAAPGIIRATGQGAEDVILTQVQFEPAGEDPAVRAFVDRYAQAYGEEPGLYAAHGYDALQVVAAALDRGTALPSDMWKNMRGLSGFSGVTGSIEFDERGDVGKYPRVYILQGGSFEDYERVIGERREQLMKRLEEIRRARERALRQGAASPDA